LEAQLQSHPEMRAALNELRQTQTLLRQAPVLRVPRNFTLTPEMAGLRTRPPRSYPAFQWAFTLASLFFIMVIAGEFFVGNPTASGTVAMAPAAESFAVEESMEESVAMDTAQADTPSVEQNTGEPFQGGGGSTDTPTPVFEGGGGSLDTPSPEFTVLMAETPTPTAESTYKSASETEVVEEPLSETAPPGSERDMSVTGSVEDSTPPPEADWWTASPWRLPQVIFGAVVLISGLGLILLRRRTML
jgi:hypothetical protein